jgi:hypothetical protein
MLDIVRHRHVRRSRHRRHKIDGTRLPRLVAVVNLGLYFALDIRQYLSDC